MAIPPKTTHQGLALPGPRAGRVAVVSRQPCLAPCGFILRNSTRSLWHGVGQRKGGREGQTQDPVPSGWGEGRVTDMVLPKASACPRWCPGQTAARATACRLVIK